MARIRSIHPGLFTDEAFVTLSMTARVLYVGALTEADDHGVFEWKPVRLKIRLMPVDAVDVPALLDEMVECGSVKKFSSDGKIYGLVRNFCRYQRPKKPKYTFPLPSEFYTYAGLKEDGSLPPLHQSGTDGEKSPQREEGGDLRKEESGIGEGGKPAPAKPSNSNFGREGPLTLDFVASDETMQTIRASGFGEKQFNNEFSKFVAYYMARGAVRADWNAQLVSWFQRAKPDAAQAAPAAMVNQVFVVEGTPEWSAWTQFWRETKRKSVPLTDGRTPNGALQRGWYFPTAVPPGYDEATGERIAPANQEENAA